MTPNASMSVRVGAREDLRRNRSALWRAVTARDRGADGAFVYGVRSTGIYCRPSCPSRKPRREQVIFFLLPQAAERQGFRPCRRCQPGTVRPRDARVGAVANLCREIDARMLTGASAEAGSEKPLTLGSLSRTVGMSAHQLLRAFRSVMGITPRQYADAQRVRLLKARLRKGDNVTTALYEAGYGSASRLYENAQAHLGMTPAAYGRGGAGMKVRHVIVGSPRGKILVGATEHGISAVYLGRTEAELRAELRKEYPRAELLEGRRDRLDGTASRLEKWVAHILAHLRGQEPHLDLPTDVQATAFQRRVWEELRRIPYGTTKTYSEVARAIGHPKAIRAVAHACATNPTSVVVPCHRVVREGGALAGYRWGIERKRALLQSESEQAKKNS